MVALCSETGLVGMFEVLFWILITQCLVQRGRSVCVCVCVCVCAHLVRVDVSLWICLIAVPTQCIGLIDCARERA